MTGISQHVGPPAVSTGNVDDDPGHVQKARFSEPPPARTARQGTRDSQLDNAGGLPPATRLDGEVVRLGGIPFANGTDYELWTGQWKKGAGEVGGGRVEKVSLSLTTPIILI